MIRNLTAIIIIFIILVLFMILVFGYFKYKRVFYLLKLFIFIDCNSYIKSECTISISKSNSLKHSNSWFIYINKFLNIKLINK